MSALNMTEIITGLQLSKRNDEENYLIKEVVKNPTRTAVQGQIKHKTFELRIDSGASKSFIGKHTAEKLGLTFIEEEEITTIFGNSNTEVTRNTVDVEIKIEGLERLLKENLYILDSLPEAILLGNEFLFNNELVLDYKNRVVMISDKMIPMIGREMKLRKFYTNDYYG